MASSVVYLQCWKNTPLTLNIDISYYIFYHYLHQHITARNITLYYILHIPQALHFIHGDGVSPLWITGLDLDLDMSTNKRKLLWQWYCHCEEPHLKLFCLHKNYVNVNWKSKLILKFASRQRAHMWLICVVFSLSDKPSVMLTSKKQLTWQSVKQHLAKLEPNIQN